VQGVFFRDFTSTEATFLGLAGWVKNLFDGRVEVLAEGEKEDLEKLLTKLKQGPPGARVKNVEVIWEDYLGEFHEFRITWY
jgi:acylphosphatase